MTNSLLFMPLSAFNLRSRFRAAGIHLLISVAGALATAALVFMLWYPWPYRAISGGQTLLFLVVLVDVTIGPLLTFVIFDIAKSRRHLVRDLIVVSTLQLVALTYGLYTLYVARPIAMVFEVDRFHVITANDVYLPELAKSRLEFRRLPLTGPWLLGTRGTRDNNERTDAIFMALKSFDVGQRPIFWQSYAESRAIALAKSRPVEMLAQHYPARQGELDAILRRSKLTRTSARFLPLVARQDWIVLLSANGNVVDYAPFDGFF